MANRSGSEFLSHPSLSHLCAYTFTHTCVCVSAYVCAHACDMQFIALFSHTWGEKLIAVCLETSVWVLGSLDRFLTLSLCLPTLPILQHEVHEEKPCHLKEATKIYLYPVLHLLNFLMKLEASCWKRHSSSYARPMYTPPGSQDFRLSFLHRPNRMPKAKPHPLLHNIQGVALTGCGDLVLLLILLL